MITERNTEISIMISCSFVTWARRAQIQVFGIESGDRLDIVKGAPKSTLREFFRDLNASRSAKESSPEQQLVHKRAGQWGIDLYSWDAEKKKWTKMSTRLQPGQDFWHEEVDASREPVVEVQYYTRQGTLMKAYASAAHVNHHEMATRVNDG